jgi:hypothetical protein
LQKYKSEKNELLQKIIVSAKYSLDEAVNVETDFNQDIYCHDLTSQ